MCLIIAEEVKDHLFNWLKKNRLHYFMFIFPRTTKLWSQSFTFSVYLMEDAQSIFGSQIGFVTSVRATSWIHLKIKS